MLLIRYHCNWLYERIIILITWRCCLFSFNEHIRKSIVALTSQRIEHHSNNVKRRKFLTIKMFTHDVHKNLLYRWRIFDRDNN